jgi:tetratricopeptide (TPR) repeat protein
LCTQEVQNITDLDESIDFITDIQDEKVFVVVEESTKDYIISILTELSQIEEIYIYCTNNTKCNFQILNSCTKYKGVFYDFASLYQQIEQGTKTYMRDSFIINIISDKKVATMNDTNTTVDEKEYNTQEASFMYHRLIMTTLIEMKEDQPKDMIDFCRIQYADNQSSLAAVKEFEQDYESHSPIWWYTREGFLYKILNKSLREQDVLTLYSFRTFICHLYEQIVDIFLSQNTKYRNITTTIMTFYRGQQMTIQTFERIKSKTGGLLSFSNFLSTTTNKDVATIYAGNTLNDQNMAAVLFQFSININVNEQLFAKIDQISYFGTAEEEYLFAMGSVFRIERIDKLNDEVWNIYLKTTNEFDVKLKELTDQIIDEIECGNPLRELGKILQKLDEQKKAEFFYLKALHKETNWEVQAAILQALKIIQENIQVDYHSLYGSIYNNIGVVYQAIDEYDLALVYMKESLACELCNPHPNKRKLSIRYHNIGMTLLKHEKKVESEHYLRQALNMALEVLPPIHPDIAVYYNNLAFCMSAIGRFVEAVDYEQKAVDINLHCLPLDHQETQIYQHRLKMYQETLEVMIEIANINKEEGLIGVVFKDSTIVHPRRKRTD